MKLQEAQKVKKFKLLQVGNTGVGKTTRTVDATRFGPLKIFDFDGKLVDISLNFTDEQKQLIDVEITPSIDEYKKQLLELSKIPADKFPFATICIDSLSFMHSALVEDVQVKNPKMSDGRQIYGQVFSEQMSLLNRLFSLPCNIIINGHLGESSNPDGSTSVSINTTGKFGSILPSRVSEVHYLKIDMNKYKVFGRAKEVAKGTIDAKSIFGSKLKGDGSFETWDLSIFDPIAFKVKV